MPVLSEVKGAMIAAFALLILAGTASAGQVSENEYPVGDRTTMWADPYLIGSLRHMSKIFSSRPVPRGETTSVLPRGEEMLALEYDVNGQNHRLKDYLERTRTTGLIVVIVAAIYFGGVIGLACRDKVERHRVFVIFLLFLGAAMFWSGFEQAGSSMNIYARDLTDRVIFGWETPTSWLQSVNPIFIILLAPVMGMLWVQLGARNPSIPVKFGMGLALLGVGFLVLAWGSLYVPEGAAGNPEVGVAMTWLVVTFFFHTVGELALSPVGLSSVTKLSPHRLVGQMMGTWFMGAALGNLVAGLIAGRIETLPPEQLFTVVASISVGSGLLFLLFAPLINRATHGVK